LLPGLVLTTIQLELRSLVTLLVLSELCRPRKSTDVQESVAMPWAAGHVEYRHRCEHIVDLRPQVLPAHPRSLHTSQSSFSRALGVAIRPTDDVILVLSTHLIEPPMAHRR